MIVRQRLLAQMANLSLQSKWEQTLSETINEMLEIKPLNTYLFTQKKSSLKQKFDNSKTSQYLIELTMYLTHLDPLTTTEHTIKDKIINVCVQKYQHTKIKKTEIVQLITVVLQSYEQQKKQQFVKLLDLKLDQEIYTILEYAEFLYYAVVYRACLAELEALELKLKEVKINLDRNLLIQYLNTVNEKNSILKKMEFELQGDVNVYRWLGQAIHSKKSV